MPCTTESTLPESFGRNRHYHQQFYARTEVSQFDEALITGDRQQRFGNVRCQDLFDFRTSGEVTLATAHPGSAWTRSAPDEASTPSTRSAASAYSCA